MPSPIDQRRLRDATKGEAVGDPETIEDIDKALEVIFDAILAIQSLDDLGPEGNAEASAQEKWLFAREKELKLKRYSILQEQQRASGSLAPRRTTAKRFSRPVF